ncbi:hypothetical protein BKG92_02445 [Rodentibacter ratti]|uniref:Uncharacterized protein n=1 Tax=Rodentibacter ratti TaxID=1906745 RepID=A0A1V3L158_9PAST|nr:hypothetical protein BKG92_02445 [Rodentibacter ratti]OOF86941.1 hypothetical protein BKG88_02690 [Rodentibacter ratti]
MSTIHKIIKMNEQYDTVKQGKLKLKESEPFFLVIFSLLAILNTASLSIYTKIEASVDASIFYEQTQAG